jgi:uncharacterized protein YndB with AHSA1/START domain
VKKITITVSRTIPASPADVYDVWLDPNSPGGPWHGNPHVILDTKVDGLYYMSMLCEGQASPHYGRFLRLERGKVIEHTWMSESTHGLESLVTVTFEPKGKDTLMTLRHADLPDDEMGRAHEEGWAHFLAELATKVS